MKKLLFFIISVLALSSSEAIGQCNSEALSNECVPKLASGFNFLKSYKVDGADGTKDKVEYSYVFTKGTQYMINICATAQPTDGIVVTLFDSQRKKVATSKADGQYISAMAFACNATGIYYIQYTFDESTTYCAGSALGFKR
jgi:hypothetical protein